MLPHNLDVDSVLVPFGPVDQYTITISIGRVINRGQLTVINVRLKRSRFICQPDNHISVFDISIVDRHCSLPLVTCLDLNVVVTVAVRQIGEDQGFTHLIE